MIYLVSYFLISRAGRLLFCCCFSKLMLLVTLRTTCVLSRILVIILCGREGVDSIVGAPGKKCMQIWSLLSYMITLMVEVL